MAKKESTTTTTVATEKKKRRNIRTEIDAIPEGPVKAKIEERYAAFLDDKEAFKASKKKLFAGLDFIL